MHFRWRGTVLREESTVCAKNRRLWEWLPEFAARCRQYDRLVRRGRRHQALLCGWARTYPLTGTVLLWADKMR